MIDRLEDLRIAAGPATPSYGPGRMSVGTQSQSSFFRSQASERSFGQAAGSERRRRSQEPPSMELFLRSLDEIREGPLRELQALLVEAKVLQGECLTATMPQRERDALAKAEACAERAGSAAQRARLALEGLAREVEGVPAASHEADLRRQSFAGVSVMFQNALNAYFQAQVEFRQQMEAKVRRQLQAAFPEADEMTVAAAAAGQSSAMEHIQAAANAQPAGQNLAINLAVIRLRCDELADLARAAHNIRLLFLDVHNLVAAQGESIDDIAIHVALTRDRTALAQATLADTYASQQRCRWRWAVLCLLVVLALVTLFILWIHFG